jgi:hypothetical protein
MRFSLIIDGIPVDQFQDETIQLTREIKNFLTAEAKTDFTQQFNIPSTPTNDPIFQNYFDENSVFTGWNAFLKLDAKIYIHSIPIFDGCVELTGVEFKNGLPRQYNLIFYGQGKKAIADWGEKTLPMVDWTAYNHTVDYTNVIDSWFGNLLSGAVLYPVADWHLGMQYCKVPIVSNNLYSGGLAINDLRPALRFREFITACFADIDYTLSGSLLDKDYFDKLFVIPMNGAGPIQNTGNEDAKINVTIGSTTLNSTFRGLPLIFTTEVSDPLDLYNTTTGEYEVPFAGEYTFQLTLDVQSVSNALNYIGIGTASGQGGTLNYTTSGVFVNSYTMQLSKGDIVKTSYANVGNVTLNSASLVITSVPYGIDGSTLNFKVVMPEIKVTDFINNFLKTFNAVLIPTSETNFELHNIDDYYELGVKKDWTEYIDMTDIRHEKVPIPKRIDLRHSVAEDVANVEFTNLYNREYGSMVASPEVDFSAEELTVESPFTLFLPNVVREQDIKGINIRDTELQIQRVLDGDYKATKADLILAYFVERKTITTDTFQLDGIDQFSYPLMSSYQDFPTTTATHSLGFGIEATLSGDAPASTIYTNFYQRYLSRLFSSKSRIVHFDAILPVGEWLQLEMNDTISVSGNLYKIESIEYDILNEKAHLVLISYPDVDLQTYDTTGNNTDWVDGELRPDGVTTLNGDAVGRGVTNSKDNVGGGTGVTILGQKSFGDSTMAYLKRAVDEIVKNRSVFVATNDSVQVVTVDGEGNFTQINLNQSYALGNPYPYILNATSVGINVSATYKVTAEIGFDHSHGHDIGFGILLNGLLTSGYVNAGTTDQATSVSEVLELPEGSEVSAALACLDSHAGTVEVRTIKLRVEKI